MLDLIRRGERTVNTLAAHLRISDNAVRVHLVALERDGLIKRIGTVRSGGAGQPAAEYDLTPSGEQVLSQAFPAALVALAAAAGAPTAAPRAVRTPADQGSLQERAESCATLIENLGGSATVTVNRGNAVIQGAGCPLAAAVRGEPGTCFIVEGLLESHAGVKAEQQCTHGDRPSCRFRLTV